MRGKTKTMQNPQSRDRQCWHLSMFISNFLSNNNNNNNNNNNRPSSLSS